MKHTDALIFEIREHLARFWPEATVCDVNVPQGPVQQLLPDFRVVRIAPTDRKQALIYCTVGASLAEEADHVKHEFFLAVPIVNDEHATTLAMLANVHADSRYRLDVGRVVAIGEPVVPSSRCDHLLISLPYPYGPKLEWLETAYGCVRFLWTLPITEKEAHFAREHGAEALERIFDQRRIDYLDFRRFSVV